MRIGIVGLGVGLGSERLHYCHFGKGETNGSSGKLFSTVIIMIYHDNPRGDCYPGFLFWICVTGDVVSHHHETVRTSAVHYIRINLYHDLSVERINPASVVHFLSSFIFDVVTFLWVEYRGDYRGRTRESNCLIFRIV